MITKILSLTEEREERIAFISSQFPIDISTNEIYLYPGKNIPWHWHGAIELAYVIQGKLSVKTNHEEMIVSAGQGIFINSNFLHSYEAIDGTECIYICIVVDPSVLMGSMDSVFAQKYVLPVIRCRDIEMKLFAPTTAKHRKIIECISNIQLINEDRKDGYEVLIRNELSELWLVIYMESKDIMAKSSNTVDTDGERVKLMMAFIQDNYQDKLLLAQIADAANISSRECLRDFRKILGKSPFEYLIEYRVQKASDLLLDTNLPITDIGEQCGFSSPSYFTKIFGRIRKCSPKEFRKLYKKEEVNLQNA